MIPLKLDNTFISQIAAEATVLEAAKGSTKILRCRPVIIQICIASL